MSSAFAGRLYHDFSLRPLTVGHPAAWPPPPPPAPSQRTNSVRRTYCGLSSESGRLDIPIYHHFLGADQAAELERMRQAALSVVGGADGRGNGNSMRQLRETDPVVSGKTAWSRLVLQFCIWEDWLEAEQWGSMAEDERDLKYHCFEVHDRADELAWERRDETFPDHELLYPSPGEAGAFRMPGTRNSLLSPNIVLVLQKHCCKARRCGASVRVSRLPGGGRTEWHTHRPRSAD